MTRTLRSRRLALVSAVLVVGLTACGVADDPVATDVSSSRAPLDDGPAVIQVAGGGAGSEAGAPAAESRDAAMSDKMMAAFLEFVYEGSAPDLTSSAPAWSFPAGVGATPEQVAAIAAALGVDGDVRTLPADQGGGFQVGPPDYTGDMLTVSSDAMQSWWFSPYFDAPRQAAECTIEPAVDPAVEGTTATDGSDATVDTVVVCPEPEPPVGVPTAAEAEARSVELLTAVGLDPAAHELETYADEWGATVTAWLVLDGVRSTVSASFGFGENGELTWASGYLATPVRGDDYPRIGVDAAVERLNEQQQAWLGISSRTTFPAGDVPVAVDEPVAGEPTVGESEPAAVEDAPAAEAGESPAAPPSDVVVDPLPVDPLPVDVEPIVVTLSGGEPTLEQIWAVDGTVWLVPGYAFETSDGGRYTVAAIPDEYLQLQDVPEVEPAPLPEPLPVESTEPAEPLATDPVATEVPAPGVAPVADAATAWIGLDLAAAEEAAAAAGFVVRAVRIDGVDQPITMDYLEQRANVAVVDGIVTEVVSIG